MECGLDFYERRQRSPQTERESSARKSVKNTEPIKNICLPEQLWFSCFIKEK